MKPMKEKTDLPDGMIKATYGPHTGPMTEPEMRKMFNIPDEWESVKFEAKKYDPVLGKNVVPTIGTSFWCHGVWKPPARDIMVAKEILAEMRKASPRRKPRKYTVIHRPQEANMLEVSIPDLHLGMRTNPEDTDGSYDMGTAKFLFMWAIEELLRLTDSYAVEKILFPMGNDFLHVDNTQNATTAGTFQGAQTDYHDLFRRGRDLLIEGIDRLKQRTAVHVLAVPGNHDYNASIHMSYVIDAYYNNDPNVVVDAGSAPSRYVKFGRNLIGFDHGRFIAPIRLASMMAADKPKEWAECPYRCWHLGDQHRRGYASFAEHGVNIEYLPSLNIDNSWHRKMSYTHHPRSAVAFIYNKQSGEVCRFSVNVDHYAQAAERHEV